jgi:hypothetical protein
MAMTEGINYTVRDTDILQLKAGAIDEYFQGGIASIGADGYVKVAEDEATAIPIGVFKTDHSADGTTHEEVEVETGEIWVKKKVLHTSTVLCTDDSGNSNANYDGKYFELYNLKTGYYVWFQVGTKGYQECGLTGKSGAGDTGLSQETAYKVKVAINGGTVTEYTITTPAETVTYTILLALLNAAIAGTTWSLESGDLRCTSNLVGATSAIAITAGTSADLLAALSITVDAAVAGTDTDSDPEVSGLTGIEVPILATDNAAAVAVRLNAIIDAHASFTSTVNTATVTIVTISRGYTIATVDGDLSTVVTIANTVYGMAVQSDVGERFWCRDDDGVVYVAGKSTSDVPAGYCKDIDGEDNLLIDFRLKTLS